MPVNSRTVANKDATKKLFKHCSWKNGVPRKKFLASEPRCKKGCPTVPSCKKAINTKELLHWQRAVGIVWMWTKPYGWVKSFQTSVSENFSGVQNCAYYGSKKNTAKRKVLAPSKIFANK